MKIAEVDLLKESTYQTPCGTIHYWSNNLSLDTTTLVFLPGLTADHRLFDKQVGHFVGKYNIIVWDAPAHAGSCIRYNREWHRKTKIPLKWIEGAGHNSNTDKPDMINSLLEEFFSNIL